MVTYLFFLSESGTVAVSAVVGVNIETMTGIEGSASHLLAMNLALHKSACGEIGEVALLSFLTLSSLRPQPSFPAESWLLPCLGHSTHTAFLCPIIPWVRDYILCVPLFLPCPCPGEVALVLSVSDFCVPHPQG